MIHRLTRKEVPNKSKLLWVSDVHVGIEHRTALELMIEAAEAEGVTHVIAGGDIYDCHSISDHPKDPERILEQGTLLEEAESGRWFTDWLTTRGKNTIFLPGNHEGRIDRFVAKWPALYGLTIKEALGLPDQWTHLDEGDQIQLGNLLLSHGNVEFQRGLGGKYPAQKLLDMDPDHSTIVGHVHRIQMARRSSFDENGIKRTRAGYTMGHMSHEEKHEDYAGRNPNWQMGFGFIDVFWEGDRPRWNVSQIEVLFDRRNRPYFWHGGLYR